MDALCPILLVAASGLGLAVHLHGADLHDTLGAVALVRAVLSSRLPRRELV